MGKVDIERGRAIIPAHAEQVAERDKCVGADQYPAGTEKSVLRETLDDPKMLRRRGRATQGKGCLRLRRERFVAPYLRETLDQCAHPFVVRADVGHAAFAGEVPVRG